MQLVNDVLFLVILSVCVDTLYTFISLLVLVICTIIYPNSLTCNRDWVGNQLRALANIAC